MMILVCEWCWTSKQQLAEKVNLRNFDCGIEKNCYADQVSKIVIECLKDLIEHLMRLIEDTEQLCQPVRGKEWYILVAAQEWNGFMNIIYQAIGWAMTMIQGEFGLGDVEHHPDG